ncbi:Holliday junction resolvase RuvX [bacterium]|nr:Holliday junction resolvase RuvX [bacterium]
MVERPRVLGLDPGRVRVGLALSDPLGITAQGLPSFVRGRGSLLAHLAELIAQHAVARLVVGLPRRLDGSEGDAALAARRLAARLAERFGLPVELWDERLTTAAARRSFPPGERHDWDRLAAVFILQSWLDAQVDPDRAREGEEA